MELPTLLIWFSCVSFSHSYNILAVFPHEGKSHQMIFGPIIEELLKRGHSVTALIHNELKVDSKRYDEIILDNPDARGLEVIDVKHLQTSSVWYRAMCVEFVLHEGLTSCDSLFSNKNVMKLIRSDQKFDLILGELFNSECSQGFVHRFKAPLVAISTTPLISWYNERFANPDNPSYIPHTGLWFGNQMSFSQRLVNLVSEKYTQYLYNTFLDKNKKLLEKHIGEEISDFNGLMRNTSLILVNTHWTMTYPQPLVPAIVPIGGVHIQKAKRLPQVS